MATYYWVGGTGTWDTTSTTNWSLSSGGAGGAGVPGSGDTATFNSASGSGTVTTATGVVVNSISLNTASAGLTLKLGDNLTSTTSITHTSGALDLNNYNLTTRVANSASNTNVRSIAFGTSGQITLTSNNTTIWNYTNTSNFSYTGTSKIVCNYSGSTGTRTINHGGTGGGTTETNALNFYITAGSDIITIYFAKNLDFTGFTGTTFGTGIIIYENLILNSGMSHSGFIYWYGTSQQNITTNGVVMDGCFNISNGGTLKLQDNVTLTSTRTVTLTKGTLDLNSKILSTGLFSSSNSNTRTIAFGTGNITLTSSGTTIWAISSADNFTYTGTPTVNLTYSGATGTRTVNHAGTSGATTSNAVSFNVTAGTDTFVLTGIGRNLDFTGFNGTFNPGSTGKTLYGNLTLSSGLSIISNTGTWTFAGTSGTQQITTNNQTLDFPLTFNGVGGTFEFQDALTMGSTRALTLTNGTVKLKAGVTSTVGSFVTSGTNQKYLQSTVSGSQATLSDASGTNSTSYTTIQDINATGGATWNAYYANGNIDGGNNTNWNFGGTPSYDAEYGYKLRSFTETGRF